MAMDVTGRENDLEGDQGDQSCIDKMASSKVTCSKETLGESEFTPCILHTIPYVLNSIHTMHTACHFVHTAPDKIQYKLRSMYYTVCTILM